MKDNTSEITTENGKNIISSNLLEEMLSDRDRSIERIRLATEIRKRQLAAKNETEYNNISIPDEFLIFKHEPRSAMHYYVSGFTLADRDGTPRCRYGAMGAPASVLLPTLYRGELCDYGETAGYSSLGRFIRNGAFDSAFDIFNGYIRHNLQESLTDSKLLDRFQNKDYVLKALKRQGYELCSQLHIHTDNAEMIATLNNAWNPVEFAEKEGIEYTPFIVLQ